MNNDQSLKEYMDLLAAEKFDEALTLSRQIIASNPPDMHFYYNHAMLVHILALERNSKPMFEESLAAMTKAKEILPNCPIIRRWRSEPLFQLGHYREGFAEAEHRFRSPLPESPQMNAALSFGLEFVPRFRASYPQPDWDGTDLNGKTILVFNEFGHGDLVQNLRYLSKLKERGAKVIMEVKPELVRLIKTASNIDEVAVHNKADKVMSFFTSFTNRGQKPSKSPQADYAMSLHSLTYHFDPDLTSIPMELPYLHPTPTSDNKAVELVNSHSDKFKIGVSWAGSWKDGCDKYRSCHLKHFKPLSDLPGVQLFSLQKTTDLGKMKRTWWGNRNDEIKVDLLEGSEGVDYVDLDPMLNDFYTTAEVIQNLDLVVTVDTAVAHIAGALNKPVWVAASSLHYDWRWDIKWYNSLHVLRQKALGDWDGLFKEISYKLVHSLGHSEKERYKPLDNFDLHGTME